MIAKRWLSTGRGCALIVLLALLLVSPALGTGLVADDLFHELMLAPNPGIPGLAHRPFDLFAFATGEAANNHRLIEEGVFPWWTDPTAALAFFRPLTCVTHLLDHWLWAHNAVLMHFQSMLWFAAMLIGVAWLYRRLLVPPWMAGLALLLYAVDDARAPAVAWIANRNALVSMAFATPALALHDRWRRDGDRHAAWLGPTMLAIGLLGGETASALVGYLVAYAVCLDRGTRSERLLSLLPSLLVILAWRALYVWTGHGVIGSGVYVDLARTPLEFGRIAIERFPLLLSAALFGPWADVWEPLGIVAPGFRPWLLAWSALVLTTFTVLVQPIARRDPVTRFFLLGSLLATVPMCSTFVHDRLLTAPCLGSMAAIARVLAAQAEDGALPGRTRTVLVRLLATVHLLVGPLLAPVRAYTAVGEPSRMLSVAYDTISRAPSITHKTVVLLNPPFDPFASYFQLWRQVWHTPRPEHWRWLATGATELRITRLDERTLDLEAGHGWLSTTSERMLRNPMSAPMRAGDLVDLSDVSFEVMRVVDGRPLEVRARFRTPLEYADILWMQWDSHGHGFIPFLPPAIGDTVNIDRVDMQRALSPLAERPHVTPPTASPP